MGSPSGGWVNHEQSWYSVPLKATDTYVITMSLTGSTGTAVLSLQNSSGTQVGPARRRRPRHRYAHGKQFGHLHAHLFTRRDDQHGHQLHADGVGTIPPASTRR